MTGGGGTGGGRFDSRRYAPVDKEGWHRVRSKHERRGVRSADVAKGNRKAGGGEITSLYFTSFPERWRTWDMLQIFDKQARVNEVVIPARRNAQGRRFGFVRFFDVKEPERLATILDNIFIEGEKLHVNLPRFQREKKQIHRFQPMPSNRCKKVKKIWVKKQGDNPSAQGSLKKGVEGE